MQDWKFTGCAIQDSRFTLVNNKELYDLEADAGDKSPEYDNVIAKYPELAAKLRTEDDKWRTEIQPFLVNEGAFGPRINPMKALYWEQFGGSPDKEMMRRMSPSRLILGKKKANKK